MRASLDPAYHKKIGLQGNNQDLFCDNYLHRINKFEWFREEKVDLWL
jgi:hypothetical protein